MRIGIDASSAVSPHWGGPENYSYYLIHEFAKMDKSNEYYLYFNHLPIRPLPQQDNFRLVYFTMPRFWTHLGLPCHLVHDKIDVFFSPAHSLPFILPSKIPCLYTVHDLAFVFLKRHYDLFSRFYLNLSVKYSARRANQVLAVSVSTKRDLVEQLNIEEQKVTVVPNGYDGEVFYPVESSKVEDVLLKYELTDPYLLNVATIQPRKNHIRLIESFSKVARRYNQDSKYRNLKLVLVGKPGWQYRDIYDSPRKFGVEDRVLFLGHIPDQDVPSLMTGALALTYPSLYEGFGLAALEAMACGTVVLTSNISSLPEAVGSCGVLTDPYSINSLTEGIVGILEMTSEQRETLINNGLKRAADFTWQKAAERTLTLLKSLIYDTS